jgi:heme oxygenase
LRSPLLVRLREETAKAHAALEATFNLNQVLSGPEVARRVLERFYGFHAVWEAAMARTRAADFAAERSRLSHLHADLERLGCTEADLASLARCEPAADVPASRAGEIGSLYVLEGSTLGGQIISRALKDASWAPAEGLTYFDPYGPRTGEKWRSFMAWADSEAAEEDAEAICAKANETFELLRAWLPGGG